MTKNIVTKIENSGTVGVVEVMGDYVGFELWSVE
jgi:hypothetical protein